MLSGSGCTDGNGGSSGNDGVGRGVAGDPGAGTGNGSGAEGDAGEDEGAGADERAGSDGNFCGLELAVRAGKKMGAGAEIGFLGDGGVLVDFNFAEAVGVGAVAEAGAVM